MQIWMIAEAQNVAHGSRNPCEDLFPWANAYPTKEAAGDALREVMRMAVNAAYEDDDDPPDIDDILDYILDNNSMGLDTWFWRGPDREVVWTIRFGEI